MRHYIYREGKRKPKTNFCSPAIIYHSYKRVKQNVFGIAFYAPKKRTLKKQLFCINRRTASYLQIPFDYDSLQIIFQSNLVERIVFLLHRKSFLLEGLPFSFGRGGVYHISGATSATAFCGTCGMKNQNRRRGIFPLLETTETLETV